MKKWIKITSATLIVMAVAVLTLLKFGVGMFATQAVYSTNEGAIDGYDPVAYFTEGRPVKGSDEYTHEWQGAKWKFASASNRARFRAAPEEYAPQFGGYCAYAVASGYTARIAADAWAIVDGRLYLNFDAATREQWQADAARLINRAEQNWPRVLW